MSGASNLIAYATTLLALLALPVVLVCLYDKFVLEKGRPAPLPDKPPPSSPLYVRIAWNLLPFVLIAVVIKIGVNEVFDWARVGRRAAQLARRAGRSVVRDRQLDTGAAAPDRRGRRTPSRIRR